jgi:hypothetical protein
MEIKRTSALVVADELKQTRSAVDSALLQMSRLTSSMIEVGTEAELPAADGQKALEAAADSFQTFVVGRARFVDAHRHMVAIKGRSNLKEVDIGCGFGNPLTGAELASEEVA